ncbi:PEP utilizing enzyme [Vibrio phage VP-1]|uniref:PEP utilizing enzyme n=1 Tax=Vibrio phage VP-1 TaxID=2234088 RepID=A0A4P2TEB3_9CAUD|nr:PEP utilizing enzyme [Vibrio phage VP-1]
MSKRKISSVPFTVTGEYLANYLRQIMIDKGWRSAYKSVMEDIVGINDAQTIEFLSGKKTFAGDSNSGIEFIDWEDSEEKSLYLEEVNEKYKKIWCCDELLLTVSEVVRDGRYVSQLVKGDGECPNQGAFYREVDPNVYAKYFDTRHYQRVTLETDPDLPERLMLVFWKRADASLPPPWIEECCKSWEAIRHYDSSEIRIRELDSYKGLKFREMDRLQANGIYQAVGANRDERVALMERRKAILDQNGDDFIEITGHKIPRKPLIAWGLRRSDAKHLADCDWKAISPSGEKMMNDCAAHTDWVIGAGFDPAHFYRDHKEINDAAFAWCYDLNRKLCSADLLVLTSCRGSELRSKVQQPQPNDKITCDIVVIEDASTRWIKVAEQVGKRGGIIICEKGGPMSHLTIKGQDYGITLMLHPEARTVYREGIELTVYENGFASIRSV